MPRQINCDSCGATARFMLGDMETGQQVALCEDCRGAIGTASQGVGQAVLCTTCDLEPPIITIRSLTDGAVSSFCGRDWLLLARQVWAGSPADERAGIDEILRGLGFEVDALEAPKSKRNGRVAVGDKDRSPLRVVEPQTQGEDEENPSPDDEPELADAAFD